MSLVRPTAINAVILGGNGAIGALLCERFAGERIDTTAIDVVPVPPMRHHNVGFVSADVRDLPAEAHHALAEADWVVAALPETVLLETWESIVGLLKPGALFVDTLSVKLPLISAMTGCVPPSVEMISINPMFAPSLGFKGQSVAVVEVRRAAHADHFLRLLREWGASLQYLSAEWHDRYAAVLQSATHAAILAFGLALHRLQYDAEAVLPIMTPPHRAMLSLLARILNASPEVYWDIQAQNPYAPEARQALVDGLRVLTEAVEGGDQARFRRLLADLQGMFGPERLAEFNRNCARMFKLDDE
jgi:prephenate dehydrogenase